MNNIKIKLGVCLLIALFFAVGCDGYHKREVVIDLDKDPPKNVLIVETTDLNKLFDLIEKILEKKGMNCIHYDETRRYFSCSRDVVVLMMRVIDQKTIKIEISEFGPWEETQNFSSVVEDMSNILKMEFPGKDLQLINPLKR